MFSDQPSERLNSTRTVWSWTKVNYEKELIKRKANRKLFLFLVNIGKQMKNSRLMVVDRTEKLYAYVGSVILIAYKLEYKGCLCVLECFGSEVFSNFRTCWVYIFFFRSFVSDSVEWNERFLSKCAHRYVHTPSVMPSKAAANAPSHCHWTATIMMIEITAHHHHRHQHFHPPH